MRHLYSSKPPDQSLIASAKNHERRRCNHHTLEEPLSTLECFSDVVDPKGSRTNKHRYVVASQDKSVRTKMRTIPGVPLIYVHRSVMIMEPMAAATGTVREKEERAKFSAGIKRKRGQQHVEDESETPQDDVLLSEQNVRPAEESAAKQKRKARKEPNPLSVRKKKKKSKPLEANLSNQSREPESPPASQPTEKVKPKRKRRRKTVDESQNAQLDTVMD